MMPNAQRVFAYCHDGVGIGHLYRTLSICEQVGRHHPGASFLVATGTPYVPFFRRLEQVDYIKLPALCKTAKREYASKFDTMSPTQTIRCREALLLNVVRHFLPDVLLVDKAPLGVCRELLPALEWIRENCPATRVVFGMRDIEDAREATIDQWARDGIPDALERCFDEIWVYGSQDVFDVCREYDLSPAIEAKLFYMGYVSRGACTHSLNSNGNGNGNGHGGGSNVLVTVGGGTDGDFLLRTYLEDAALRVSRMGLGSTIVGGPDLPVASANYLRQKAASIPGVKWVDFEPCLDCHIRAADLVVSMGGYNTLCQIVRNRKPALVVPRTRPRLEQLLRANLWQDRGAVQAVDPAQISGGVLADRVVATLSNGVTGTQHNLDLKGLDRVCGRFDGFWAEEKRDAATVCV